ncbi:MAG: hypothetical protein KatS3mg102_1098 [Planctomycetota bacterium]|nr:MAG: hypothetical protein KatS3mg102_1098 [Planctomycetota bacterium]
MAYWKSEALCLRVLDWRETSHIVTWFSRERGKIATVAKGARRRGSRLFGVLDPLVRAELVCYRRAGTTGLHTLCELEIRDTFREARREACRLHAALYVLELLREATAEEDPHPRLYDLAVRALGRLARNRTYNPLTIMVFEVLALAELGRLPELSRCVQCGREAAAAAAWPLLAELGGLVCPDCAARLPGACGDRQVLAPQARAALRALAAGPEQAGTLALGPAALAAMRGALDASLAAYLGRPLRLARYLAR